MTMPRSLPEALQELCRFLDGADQIIHLAALERGVDYTIRNEMQDDLRSLAIWMIDHPQSTVHDASDFFMSLSLARN